MLANAARLFSTKKYHSHSLAYYPPFFYSPRFDRRFASLQSYARGSFTQRCTHFTFYFVYTTYIIFNNKTLRARVCMSATLISLRRKQNDLQTSSKNNGRTCVNACVRVWIFVCLFVCWYFSCSSSLLFFWKVLLHKNNDYVFNCYLQLYQKKSVIIWHQYHARFYFAFISSPPIYLLTIACKQSMPTTFYCLTPPQRLFFIIKYFSSIVSVFSARALTLTARSSSLFISFFPFV